MTTSEIYQQAPQALFDKMFTWMRQDQRKLYSATLERLASDLRLRPVFIQKKSLPEQFAWLKKTLSRRNQNAVGEHLLQTWLMADCQELLQDFCDGLGIPHDGQGAVEGDLPATLDADKLQSTTSTLLEKHDPALVTLYLRVFNRQRPEGWPSLTALLKTNPALQGAWD